MRQARALYICPATQAAVVAIAPVIADGCEYRVTRTLLLQGVANLEQPTRFEAIDALRASKGITRFLESRGIKVASVHAAGDDCPGWRQQTSAALSSGMLDDIEMIVFNAQAGTKQMSFGAWEAISSVGQSANGRNLPFLRCFVRSGSALQVQFDSTNYGITDLSVTDFLSMYGFEEIEKAARKSHESWIRRNKGRVLELWNAVLSSNETRAMQIADVLCAPGQQPRCPWAKDQLLAGGWLEAGAFLKVLERKQQASTRGFVASSLKIWDWAGSVAPPTQADGRLLNHYEIDVIVASRGVVHLLECKNLKDGIQQDAIHKQGALRERFQGRAGVNAIIARRHPKADSVLGLKAAHQHIQFFRPNRDEIRMCLDLVLGQ